MRKISEERLEITSSIFSQKDVKGEIVIVVEGKNRKVRNAENEEYEWQKVILQSICNFLFLSVY